jgi:hypothetical protein
LFFSYGHIYEWLQTLKIGEGQLGRHRYLVPIWLVIFGLGVWWINKLSSTTRVTEILNLLSALLLIFPLGQLVLFTLNIAQPFENPITQGIVLRPSVVGSSEHPDVYYIILDAYGGEETLREVYGFNNQPFLSTLEDMGFQVASCSQSNYAQTDLSFASSLNFNLLPSLDQAFLQSTTNRAKLWPYIRQSATRILLEDIGYQSIAFETGFSWSEIDDADSYLAPDREGFVGFNSFEIAFLRSTAAWVLVDQIEAVSNFFLHDLDRSAEENYRRITFAFDTLENLSLSEDPIFVFAHIIAPHTPFVFSDEGTFEEGEISDNLDFESYRARYLQELTFINVRVLQVMETILATTGGNVIILLQSDHGPEKGSAIDRMSILNAYYLPGGGYVVPNEISPANSFRMIFNQYFGTQLEYLEDTSFFSAYDEPFTFNILPNTCNVE